VTPNLVDRDPQNLLVPLGGMAPARAERRRAVRRWWPDTSTSLLGIGVVGGAIGVGLLLAPAPDAVALMGDHLQVGGMVLSAVASSGDPRTLRFSGDASYVLVLGPDGPSRAAAVWTTGGTVSSGVCALHGDGSRLVDDCSFTSRAGRFSSVDVLDTALGPRWERTYDDGARVTIPVSAGGGAVPVPFPLGH
jgi:hypothetical protein